METANFSVIDKGTLYGAQAYAKVNPILVNGHYAQVSMDKIEALQFFQEQPNPPCPPHQNWCSEGREHFMTIANGLLTVHGATRY